MAEPANRGTNAAGGKYYTHPLTDEKFDSVTTILDLVDKAALKIWAGMVAADFAMDNLPQLMASILVPECGNTHNRCYLKHGEQVRCERCPCGECEKCWWRRVAWRHAAESSRRAKEGTEAHEAIDFWIANGGATVSMRKEVQPYFDSFKQWTQDYGLSPRTADGPGSWIQTEVTLINREHRYAGTSDGALVLTRNTPAACEMLDRLGGLRSAVIRVDYKSREKPDEALYYDMPLQGVAYEQARVALLPDGQEFEAPATEGRTILQLRPGGYSFKLMLSDEPVFEAFLGILAAYRWINGPGKNPFDQDRHFPVVTYERAVQTVRTVLDAEPIDEPLTVGELEDLVLEPVALSDETIAQLQAQESDPVQAFLSTEPVPTTAAPLPELPLPPDPPRKRAAKAAKKSATAKADPFELAQPSPTLASMSASTFRPGPRQTSLLDEDIPF